MRALLLPFYFEATRRALGAAGLLLLALGVWNAAGAAKGSAAVNTLYKLGTALVLSCLAAAGCIPEANAAPTEAAVIEALQAQPTSVSAVREAVMEAAKQSPAALSGVTVTALSEIPAAGRMLNSAGVYTQGLNVAEFDLYPLTAGVRSTGYNFNQGDVILDSWINITTAESTGSTKTVDVGIRTGVDAGENADGFADGLVTSATGVVLPATTFTTGNHTMYAASTTFGDLLITFQAGSSPADAGAGLDTQAAKGDEGVFLPKRYVIGATTKSLVYQLGSAHTELRGKGYVLFWRKP